MPLGFPFVKIAYDAFKDVEKRSKYKFWDKERERSNRATGLVTRGSTMRFCPLRHNTIAWSGPPHDSENRYICLHCAAFASEAMVKDMGYDFATVPDYIIHDLMDEVLAQGDKFTSYPVVGNGR